MYDLIRMMELEKPGLKPEAKRLLDEVGKRYAHKGEMMEQALFPEYSKRVKSRLPKSEERKRLHRELKKMGFDLKDTRRLEEILERNGGLEAILEKSGNYKFGADEFSYPYDK